MSIKPSGNVGIGTTSPSSILDINGAFTQQGIAAPAASPAGQGRIYFDSTENKFKVSQNGAGYTDLVNAGGGGDVTGPVASSDNAVVRFDGTTGKITQNSSVTIDDTGIVSGVAAINGGDSYLDIVAPDYLTMKANHYVFDVPPGGTNALTFSNTLGGWSGAKIQVNKAAGSNNDADMSIQTINNPNQIFLAGQGVNSGNVGIGTTTPERLLHINGPMRVTASALPLTPAAGDIAVDSADLNKLKYYNGSAWVEAGGGGSGTPAGANTQIQFNNAGSFGASTNFIWDNTNARLGVGTASPEMKLSLDSDGGIIAKGTYGAGATLATSGAGSRMIWYPRKSAFRAGNTTGTHWDNANLGDYSAAFGANTTASNFNSFASGWTSSASGTSSIAMGDQNTASGDYGSVAMGSTNTASGMSSIALGGFNSVSGEQAAALGYGLTSDSLKMVAVGSYNGATGGSTNTWVATDPIFVVGNGNGSASTALTVLKNGNVGIGTTTPSAKLQTNTSAIGSIGQIIRWGQAGQTANLLEFQNNTGTILSRVDKDGKFYGDGSGLTGITATPSGVAGSVQFSNGTILASDNANFFWDDTNNRLGIGTATPASPLELRSTNTSTSSFQFGANVIYTANPSGASTANNRAIQGTALTSGSNNITGDVSGLMGYAQHSGTGTVSKLYGGYFGAESYTGNSVGDAAGIKSFVYVDQPTSSIIGGDFRASRGSGTSIVTPLTAGVRAVAVTQNDADVLVGIDAIAEIYANPADSITSAYAGRFTFSAGATGVVGSAYGVYLGDVPTATNSYGLYQAGTDDKNYFAGNVGIGTTTPSNKLEVSGNIRQIAGQITSAPYDALSGTAFDFNNGNVQYTLANCQAMTLSNMQDGGSYTIVVKGTTSGTCSFTHAGLNFYYSPAPGPTANGSMTTYTFLRVGTDVMVTWISLYQ